MAINGNRNENNLSLSEFLHLFVSRVSSDLLHFPNRMSFIKNKKTLSSFHEMRFSMP